MNVIIDERERKEREQLLILFKARDLDTEIQTLPVGDFLNSGKSVCVERKTVSDFIGSFQSGHLQKQLKQMEMNYVHNFLVIEGDPTKVLGSPFVGCSSRQYLGMLRSAVQNFSGKVIQVPSLEATVYVVSKFIEKAGQPSQAFSDQLLLLKRKGSSREEVYKAMIMCVPGFGYEKAQILLEALNYNLEKLWGISSEDLQEIEGIGPVLAESLKENFS